MPTVAKRFREEGTEFVNHIATTPVCGPSRSSLLTGRFTHNHGNGS
jgi:arylsulfatase A-like enzyme